MKRWAVLSLVVLWGLFAWTTSVRAINGIADEVPSANLVVPIFCSEDGLNTLIAIADAYAFDNNGNPTTNYAETGLRYVIYNADSVAIFDSQVKLTKRDVLPLDCVSLISQLGAAQRQMLQQVIGGKTYYVGYVIFTDVTNFGVTPPDPDNRYAAWAYLVDLGKGLTTGFVPFQMEGGSDQVAFTEGGIAITSYTNTAPSRNVPFSFFPRWYQHNLDPESFTWWIFLQGFRQCANDVNGNGIGDPGEIIPGSRHHIGAIGFQGFQICDEEEHCVSLAINIDKDLTIIDVNEILPAVLCAETPCAGFAIVNIPAVHSAADQFSCAQVCAQNNAVNCVGVPATILGWSYSRAKDATTQGSWSAMFPMHRN